MLSSGIEPAVAVAMTTGGLTAITIWVRYYLRYRTERERWRSAERLVEQHGPDVLKVLPRLARELRDPVPDADGIIDRR